MFFLFDIGGSKTRITVTDTTSIGNVETFETPQSPQEGVDLLVKTAHKLTSGETLTAAAGGVAGPLNRENTQLVNAPNLPQWAHFPLVEELDAQLHVPISLENDAALAGLGEALYGAGKGSMIVAYITLSTGIGGARIVNGAIDTHAFGFEPGHMYLDIDKSIFPTSDYGTWEKSVSGAHLEKRFNSYPSEITDVGVWNEVAEWAAFGLHNVMVMWSPDVIVLGGGLVLTHAVTIDMIKSKFEKVSYIFPELPELREAQLGDTCALYGALATVQSGSI